MSTLTVSAPAVKPTPARMATTFAELNALPLGAFRGWGREYSRLVAILTGGASRTFGGSNGTTFDAAVNQAHRLMFDGVPAGGFDRACVAAAEATLFDPIGAAASLAGREAVMAWVIAATEPPPAPVVPTYSDDAEVESAIGEARACLYPASDHYRTNMAMLADMADRSAVVRAELDATRANLLAPVDPWDTECDPTDWTADTDADRWELAESPVCPDCGAPGEGACEACESRADAQRMAWDAMYEAADDAANARCSECGSRLDGEPCVICDDWPAPARAPLALPALCGGSPEAVSTVVYETRCEGGAWVVTRDGRTATRSRFMAVARTGMRDRAQAEADRDGVPVVALFHQPGRPVVGQTFAPRQTRPALPDAHASAERSAADYLMPVETARTISAASIVGHDA